MIEEDNTYVVKGLRPLEPIPHTSLGKLIFDKLLTNFSKNDALVDAVSGEGISYDTLLTKTCALAETLTKMGYGKNTIIGICSANCKEFFIPVIAALYIGAIIAPINHNYVKSELIHALNITKPNLVFCSDEMCDHFLQLQTELRYIKKLVIIDRGNQKNCLDSLETLINFSLEGFSLLDRFHITEVEPEEQLAFILCSSGTTGLPKGVMLTHKNVVTSFAHSDDPRLMNQQGGRCTLGVLPFYHSYGMFRGLNGIYRQIKIIVLKKFDENLFLSSIEKYKINFLSVVPPLAVFLAKSPLVDKYDLSSINDVSCGAAPLSRSTEEILKNRLRIKTVRQAYGLTETTLGVMCIPWGCQKFGSSGKIYPHLLCKVRDPETGKSLGPYQVGELCYKGPSITKGYYNNEEATRNSFTFDGWFLTGDLGYYDDEEYFFVVDRLKELIKYKGFQVPPAELEAVLLTNPKIKDAGVVGIPNEDVGELPLAFVVKNLGVHLTESEVQKYVEERVSSHKKLRGGVIFISEIPKNPSGKILRRKLREMMKTYKSKL